MKEYKIDFDLFSTEEIVKIFSFFALIESSQKRKVPASTLINRHKEYQAIVNNKALEKQYDKMLQSLANVSIYETIKLAKGKLSNETR